MAEKKTEKLSQDEIDALLDAINNGGIYGPGKKSAFESIEAFEEYLTSRKFAPDVPYGLFETDVFICRFFDSKNNENTLAEIKKKNEEEGFGNIKIQNTEIELINYSFCPNCKTVFSFNELMKYYENPKPDVNYKSRAHQYREDTRVCCCNCDAYFMPSLIILDGTPKNEVQFLCRIQTINAVEKYFLGKRLRVLTKNAANIMQNGNLKAIKNDVFLKGLEKKPTLITNMLQYTPINLMQNFIDGTNVEKGDLLFNEWS
jgi:hypothetical protein